MAGTTFIFDESRYLLTSLDLPVICNVVEASEELPYLCFVLKLEMPVVRELLSRAEIQAPEASSHRPAMATGETTAELLAACCGLVDLLNTPQDIPFLGGLIQREIIYRILRGPEGARLRAIATLGDQSHRTAKAIAWVKANYEKPLRVEDLAKLAGMGVSTLHHHFRALTAMSPLQYQKQLRLQAARGRMLIDGLDAASAAFEVGYESASQPIQSRIQPSLRPTTHEGYSDSPLARLYAPRVGQSSAKRYLIMLLPNELWFGNYGYEEQRIPLIGDHFA